MDVIELVQKQHPDFGREALLEAFVSAHFNESTGELLSEEYEFHKVLNLLGRKDLNLGDVPNRIGKISFEEKQALHIRFRELNRSAPKSKERKKTKKQAGPYLQHLTQTELMALEAFDSAGEVVTNPAVATTLVQAHLEGWMPVATLPMDAKEILMQCMNQGDMQAAFLLGVQHYASGQKHVDITERMDSDEKRLFLVESDEERLSFLTAAKAHGNPSAINWFEEKEMHEEMYESIRGDDDELNVNWMNSNIERALELGPGATGKKKFRLGVELLEANRDHFLFSNKKIFEISEYFARHELAFQWIVEAAKSTGEARYYLAKNLEYFSFFNNENVTESDQLNRLLGIRDVHDLEKEQELLRSAAFPENGIAPYYPAFIDLAEFAWSSIARNCENAERFASIVNEVRSYLEHGAEQIVKPSYDQAERIAVLWESLGVEGHEAKAAHYFSIAATKSPYAAFKCAMLFLRAPNFLSNTDAIKQYFDLALCTVKRDSESHDQKAKQYSKIALKIGWGSHIDPSSWEEASMLILELIDEQSYVSQSQNVFLLPRDVETLLQINPAHQEYKEWLEGWTNVLNSREERRQQRESALTAQALLDKKIRNIHFLYGKSDPCSVLKFLAGLANEPEFLMSDMVMNGVDGTSLLVRYVLSRLSLEDDRGRGKALGELRDVLATIVELQESPGGLGISFMATSLRWLREKSLDGINDAQPNCRRVMIGPELNGSISDFGQRFLNLFVQNFEGAEIPGNSKAVEVVYSDRYINTPFKVAILAKLIDAVIRHLNGLGRWKNGAVNIHLGQLDATSVNGQGSVNRSDSFIDSIERNDVLLQLLSKSDLQPIIHEGKVPHQRSLIVRFIDGCELRVGIEKGMGTWKGIRTTWHSINGYSKNDNVEQKAAFLSTNSLEVGLLEEGCPLYVEWHDSKVASS